MNTVTQVGTRIRISDITITHREIEAPQECPHCNAQLVATPEDDGFGVIFGTLVGQAENGQYVEESPSGYREPGLLYPKLEGVDDVFPVDEGSGDIILYIGCGNPKCGRIIVEGKVN